MVREPEAWWEFSKHDFAASDLTRPIEVIRSGIKFPDVFFPASTVFVANQTVRDRLATLPNVKFAPVRFAKLVNVQIAVGDFSFYESQFYQQNASDLSMFRAFDFFPDEAELHSAIPSNFYEIICPRLQDIEAQYSRVVLRPYSYGPPDYRKTTELAVSARLLSDYPMVWGPPFILSEEAYSLVSECFPVDFFTVDKVSVP